jgi:hypothetical protein
MPSNPDLSPAAEAAATLEDVVRAERIVTDAAAIDAAVPPWNGAVADRPAIVVRCAEVGDVRAGISVARRLGLPLSVRGRGHDWAGRSLRAGGLTYPNLLAADAVDQIEFGFGGNAGRLRSLKAHFDPSEVFSAIPLPR